MPDSSTPPAPPPADDRRREEERRTALARQARALNRRAGQDRLARAAAKHLRQP